MASEDLDRGELLAKELYDAFNLRMDGQPLGTCLRALVVTLGHVMAEASDDRYDSHLQGEVVEALGVVYRMSTGEAMNCNVTIN